MDPEAEQFYEMSPYVGMGNNPVMMVDPKGDIAFLALAAVIAKGALAGAAIGAGTSAIAYSATALATGNFNSNQFGKAIALGAVTGAISGGVASVAGNVANNIGFSILNNTTSTIAGNAILGHEQNITFGTIAGAVAGGLVRAGLPKFSGVKGGAFSNILNEISHNASIGTISGAVSGGVSAAVDRRNIREGVINGLATGAIGGAASSVLNIALFGPAFVPDIDIGDYGNNPPIFRRGGLATLWLKKGQGWALGRNLTTKKLKKDHILKMFRRTKVIPYKEKNDFLIFHELEHYNQQLKLGYSRFYGKYIFEIFKSGYRYNKFEKEANEAGRRKTNR